MEEREIYRRHERAWLDVDTVALLRNARALQLRTGAALIPMVKANAYGVGIGVVRALESLAPWGYGVATIDEGVELRELVGRSRRVIVFTPLARENLETARKHDLEPSLGEAESINAWRELAPPRDTAGYHLAIDTGMNRAGAPWRTVADLADVVRNFPPDSVFTHFHSAELDDGSVGMQSARFQEALATLGLTGAFRHADNSAAAARSGMRWDAIRPGISLYGASDAPVAPEPVVALRARVVDLRWIEPGDTVSYCATYTARSRERIATVAAGYADGYPRALSNLVNASLGGTPIPQRGLVTMDMTMFDVTATDCAVGDVVTLLGDGTGGAPTVNTAAAIAGMSPYELLTGFGHRLARYFHDGVSG